LTERIYAELKQSIFDFQLLPGDRFTESEIAQRVSASRTPVREALTRLQREGFVDVAFRSGWQVKPFDLGQYEQLYDVRLVLEQAAVSKLCQMQTRANLEELARVWLAPETQRVSEVEAQCALEQRFHEQLVAAAGNTEMARIHHDVNQRLSMVRRIELIEHPRIDAIYQEHALLLRAVIDRDAEHAQQLIAAHTERSKSDVRRITVHMLFAARDNQDASPQANRPED
jgi:DNA-binding GntR family transcriptional regulator